MTRTPARLVLIASAIVLAIAFISCPLMERICSKGEHAVRAIEAPETGRTCVRDGEPPPEGYEEYPPGQEPPTYLHEER